MIYYINHSKKYEDKILLIPDCSFMVLQLFSNSNVICAPNEDKDFKYDDYSIKYSYKQPAFPSRMHFSRSLNGR